MNSTWVFDAPHYDRYNESRKRWLDRVLQSVSIGAELHTALDSFIRTFCSLNGDQDSIANNDSLTNVQPRALLCHLLSIFNINILLRRGMPLCENSNVWK